MDSANTTSIITSDLITSEIGFNMNVINDMTLEKTDIWSVIKKCVFCNAPLDGESKLLECLHVICNNCVLRKKIDSSIQCKCHIITEGELNDYYIVSPEASTKKTCNEKDCNTEVGKICYGCKTFYCNPHSMVHNCINKNCKLILTYPLENNFVLCPTCKEKNVEVYCVVCSILTCSLCHLRFHHKHQFEYFEKWCNEMRLNLAIEQDGLYINKNAMDHYLDITDNLINNLHINKKSTDDEIDEKMKILHNEIDKQGLQLKNAVKDHFLDCVDKVNESKKVFEDIKKKNQFYIGFVQFFLNHGKNDDLVNLSTVITNRLVSFKNDIPKIVPENMSKIKIDLKCDFDETLENCISSIKTVGNVISNSSLISNIPKCYKAKTSNNVFQTSKNSFLVGNEKYTIAPDSDTSSSDSDSIIECSFCNRLDYRLIKCNSCERTYHNNCHIPSLPEGTNIYSFIAKRWTCTLCEHVVMYSKVSSENIMNGDIGQVERKIIDRILMELYCNSDDSECFKECLPKESYPEYYNKIENPISLNDIKKRWESKDSSYKSLVFVIKDLNRVFSNAMLYYLPTDPYHKSAVELKNELHKMLATWMPLLDPVYIKEM